MEIHGTVLSALSEDSIVDILKLTTPRDACRLSAVAPVFRPPAESDALWKRFLPPDYQEIFSRSSESSSQRDFSSKKKLFFSLCDCPLLIDGGRRSFWLEKKSGKKCYMLAARQLYIAWGSTPEYWTWLSIPESRFSEVAFLNKVCWFEVKGKIDAHMLSSRTKYAAYLVFDRRDCHGFEDVEVKSSVGIVGGETIENIIYLDKYTSEEDVEDEPQEPGVSTKNDGPYPEKRKDVWLEIELGDFFNQGGENMELEITIKYFDGDWKQGLIIEGIEIRPKDDL